MDLNFTDATLSQNDKDLIQAFVSHVKPWDEDSPDRLMSRFDAVSRKRLAALTQVHPDYTPADLSASEREREIAERTKATQEINAGWDVLLKYQQGNVIRWPFVVRMEKEERRQARKKLTNLPDNTEALEEEFGIYIEQDVLFVAFLRSEDEVIFGLYFDGALRASRAAVRSGQNDEEFEQLGNAVYRDFIIQAEANLLRRFVGHARYPTVRVRLVKLKPDGAVERAGEFFLAELPLLLFPDTPPPERPQGPRGDARYARWTRQLVTLLQRPDLFGSLVQDGILVVASSLFPHEVLFGDAVAGSEDPRAALSAFAADAARVGTVGEALRTLLAQGINFDHTPTVVVIDGEITRVGIASQVQRATRKKTLG